MSRIEDKVDWKELVAPPVLWDVRLRIEFGKPNGNDRVYTEEVWNKAMTEARERASKGELLVYDGEPVLHNAIACVAEIVTKGDVACAGVRFLASEKGKHFEGLVKEGYVNFFTSGVGSVKDGVVQNDYRLDYLTCGITSRLDRERA